MDASTSDRISADRIKVTVDGRSAEVPVGTTILEAARQMGVQIPTLCNYRGIASYGACRVCIVEIERGESRQQVASCSYPAEAGLVVHTDTEKVRDSRRTILELLLAQAPDSKELAEFAAGLGVESTPFQPVAEGTCILCGLCARVCNEMMGRGAVNLFGRGTAKQVQTAYAEKTDQCQACGACAFVCPTGSIDLKTITSRRLRPHNTAYDQYLTARPCIDLAHPQASPRVPYIDRDNCIHFQADACGLCSKVCGAGAINYDQDVETVDLQVGSVVLTPGFEAFDATRRGEFGFGFAPNVLTNVQFERMLSASGPTRGHLSRPSDGKAPKRLAFVQCVGSRDSGCDNDYCSSVCCMAATKEAILAMEHEPGLEVTVFFLDLRAFGKDFDRYYERAKKLGVRYVRSFISRTYEMPGSRHLRLVHMDSDMQPIEEEFDLIVLSLGLEPSASLQEQAERLGVVLNRWGFAKTNQLLPLDTSRPGVYVGGAFQEPKDIPDTVMQASAAAARAMALLAPARGTQIRTKSYPPQRDVTDEPPRVGIFVCHCGSNIASVVDVEAVVKKAKEFPNVVVAEHNVYTCASNNQDLIKERIAENRLNRVVVASCTPRTHEPIFRDTMRDSGLNPYLFEMANIRDQCSWVHSASPEQATAKATDLVRMAAARASRLVPLHEDTVPVANGALVIGGGIAGMTAALALSDQGFPVHLVEQSDHLGGTIRQIHAVDHSDVQEFLAQTVDHVRASRHITVHMSSKVEKVDGHVGGFTSNIVTAGVSSEVKHGVVVVATGAEEQKPQSYGYGKCGQVLTQLELSDRLGRDELNLPAKATVVMIQCVEQRSEERPYCSRVCCNTAVHNALRLKTRFPKARIMVLYRDMRTYGFREAAYREARSKGVLFVRYEAERPPELQVNGKLRLTVREPGLTRELKVEPDLVVLAAPMTPRADREVLSELLRVPLNADGFFLEAHMKLRPVDFASEGLFICGTAHSPKFITEAISQANAVAARAATILSHKQMPLSGQIAYVDPDKCVSCMTCVHLCAYMAPKIGVDNRAEIQGVVCMGCGSCASECPAQAISLRHYLDTQILASVNALLEAEIPMAQSVRLDYPEQTGVAPPRWHKT